MARLKLADYRPYKKQLEFHAAGVTHRERLLRAGNQLGKTWAGAAEAAYHLTGRYPDWWPGRRWDRPTHGWVGSVSALATRDAAQRVLMGPAGSIGTGYIPANDIAGYTMGRNVAEFMDTVRVNHRSGGVSTLAFKTYDQGREKWQGATLDWVWFDEEPDEDVYLEGLTRTNATAGMAWMTFTPLLGMSTVVKRFLMEKSPDRHDTNMTIDDALHIPEEERERIIAGYPAHEREARIKGKPVLGSGRIFPVAEEAIAVKPFAIPDYWTQLGGMDFGVDHPFAAVKIAHDTDADVVYVTHGFRQRETTPMHHVVALKPWSQPEQWVPWAWPQDGLQRDKGSGIQLAKLYRDHGLNMLFEPAKFEDGTNGVEAGLQLMLDRMQTGRLKVFSHLVEWFEEFSLYHRKDGLVVKLGDDLMSATRYAIMCLRFAAFKPARLVNRGPVNARREYDPMASV